MKLDELKAHLAEFGFDLSLTDDGNPILRGPKSSMRPKFLAVLKHYREAIVADLSKGRKVIPWTVGVIGRVVDAEAGDVILESDKAITEAEFSACIEAHQGKQLFAQLRAEFPDKKVMIERTFATDWDLL